MSRLSYDNTQLAQEIISRYPLAKSALIPLCHLAQEQDGWLSDDAMEHIAELVGVTPAEVLGTASFYEMFKRHPVGTHLVNICTNISCQLLGGRELLEHAEERLGVKAGNTTPDGMFTIEDVECIAACTEAPCMQVNYRYFYRLDAEGFDEVIAQIRNGDLADEVPRHGTLARVRQHIPDDGRAGNAHPSSSPPPPWLNEETPSDG